jgi:GH25 family lysozyme M1 (1,4-beta-N-acetylmuramidase)/uncharacterized protein YjdB
MKKDMHDEFDFLEELEPDSHTKAKKKKAPSKSNRAKGEDKKTASAKKSSTKKKSEPAGARVDKLKASRTSGAKKRRKKSVKEESFLVTFWQGLCENVSEMSAGDGIIVSTGVLVLVLAIITGNIYVSAKTVDNQVAAFAEIGEELGAVSVMGESGLIAVTDAQVAAMNADIIEETEETEEEEDENEDEAVEDEVLLNLTSVQRDLKIKFMNRAGGKLISGIPFKASVKGPDGKTVTYEDEDKDGIIYKTEMAPGTYEVSIVETDGLEGYKYSTDPVTVKVKDKIEYKQIDVADEIKTEAQINVAAEDTAVQEAETAPALKDTVEWVESTKTPIGTDGSEGSEYEEVDKKNIPDPSLAARARSRFRSLSAVDGSDTLIGDGGGKTDTGNQTPDGGDQTDTGNNNSDNNPQPEKPEDKNPEPEKPEDKNPEPEKPEDKDPAPEKPDENPNPGKPEQPGDSNGGNGNNQGDNKPAAPAAKVTKVTIQGASDIAVGSTVALKASVEGENLTDADKGVTWSSSDNTIASVDGSGKVTGVSAGKVTITAVSAKDNSKKAECQITVNKAAVTVTLNQTELTLKVGAASTLTASVSSGSVKWSSDNDKIVKVENGKVTAVAEGVANIKAESTEDAKVSAVCKVTVTKADALTVKLDAETAKLYTEDKKELKATVTGANGNVTYSFASDKTDIAKVEASNEKGTVTGVAAGEAVITVTAKDASGATATATCKVTVTLNPKKDSSTKLKDKDGNQLYIKNKKGEYVEATLADYYTADKFYKKLENIEYKYTGWQTIDGRTYYFDKNGNPVTGEQIIQGAKYVFGSDGALSVNSSTGIMGIDVSKWNGTIDWTAVKNSGVNYVIIRCGYRGSSTGALIQDPKFKANIQGASAAGIKVGVYFFTQAVNEVEAVEEASMVLNLVKGHKLSYPIFIDVESSGGRADGLDRNTRTAVVNAFCRTIQNGGYAAGIYANKTWFESKMNTSALSGYKIWLAQYAAAPTYKATRYDMWQYTSKGKVSGIKGDVDLNLSYLAY